MFNKKDIAVPPITTDLPSGRQSVDFLSSDNEKCDIVEKTLDKNGLDQIHLKQLNEHTKKHSIFTPNRDIQKLNNARSKMEGHILEFQDVLEYLSLKAAIQTWLSQLNEEIQTKYERFLTDMYAKQVIHEFFADGKEFTIGGLRYIRHKAVIEYIQQINDWSEDEKNERANCYKELIAYMNKISYGWFARALHDIYQMSPKTINKTLTFQDWRAFINRLYETNQRDAIIARCLLQSVKRVSPILNLTIDQIDFQNNIIYFAQKKDRSKNIPTYYDAELINELKEYIRATAALRGNTPYVFITRKGNPVTRSRLNYSFAQASLRANIKKVTPESLRAIATIFTQQGFKESAIMHNKKKRTQR